MNEEIFLLVVAYVLLAILMQIIMIYSSIAVWIKFFIVTILCIFYFVSYQSLSAITGWPSRDQLPEKFILNASHVIEPDKQDNSLGRIYLWLTAVEDFQPSLMPRAYQLQYSENLHLKLEQAEKKLRRGLPQMGEVNETKLSTAEKSSVFSEVDDIKIYDVPMSHLPEK